VELETIEEHTAVETSNGGAISEDLGSSPCDVPVDVSLGSTPKETVDIREEDLPSASEEVRDKKKKSNKRKNRGLKKKLKKQSLVIE
jgi:hypothetical protein